ncbi:MAG: hydantoinase/oxoprolinase family protein [Salinigranum sp.]
MVIRTRIGVDVGGTFTDVALLTASGDLVTAKVPSTGDQSEGVVAGIRKACERAGVDPADVEEFTHAMTVSVNALLEGTGAKTALVTTAGFRDVLEIGRQARPSLYDLDCEKPAPLVPRRRRHEIDERATVDGVRDRIDPGAVRDLAAELRAEGVESVAVVFLHAYAHPENEQVAARVLREELDVPVSASHEVLAEFREFERTATTAVDAYVTPEIDRYLGSLDARVRDLGAPSPRVMQSNGGVAASETVRSHAVSTTLSGPAAGVVGARRAARAVEGDLAGAVTFDMGGTSSDVSLVRDGEVERTTETEIDGIPVRTPMVDVHTIGSGGGSVAWVDDGGALRVGPESAGSEPGPACYGRGGTRATVTDANLVLGYLGDGAALGGELTLDGGAARDALAALADDAGLDSPLSAARGVYRVANAKMTRAIRAVTVERGFDPREFALVAFGGAGPMHAASLAGSLGIGTVVVPLAGGVLSAYGLLDADEQYDAVRTYLVELTAADADDVVGVFEDLADGVLADVDPDDDPVVEFAADLRYVGQSFEQTVPIDLGSGFDAGAVREGFEAAHERAYGYRIDESVQLVNLRATARVPRSIAAVDYEATGEARRGRRTAYFGGDAHDAAVYERRALAPGTAIDGPAIVEGSASTTVIPPGWSTAILDDGTAIMTDGSAGETGGAGESGDAAAADGTAEPGDTAGADGGGR